MSNYMINDNGVYREMTAEEIAEMERLLADLNKQDTPDVKPAPIKVYDGTMIINAVYTADLSGEVVFTLPTPTDLAHENRIRMLANVAADTVIHWGTDVYYGAAVPFVTEGQYEFLWDYNPLLSAWVVGATRIGQVVTA